MQKRIINVFVYLVIPFILVIDQLNCIRFLNKNFEMIVMNEYRGNNI